MLLLFWLCLLLWTPGFCHGFYVQDIPPNTYQMGEDVPLKVNALTSVHTQIPKDHYCLPFCRPEEGTKMESQNLGEFLTGNKIKNSPFVVQMLEEKKCQKLCQTQLNSVEARRLQQHIRFGYHYNWIIDNLPSANVAVNNGWMQKHYAGGFPIGFIDSNEKEAYIFNHVKLIIDYHAREDGYRVISFGVEPTSVKHRFPHGYEWDGYSLEGHQKQLETCPSSIAADFITQDYVDSVQIVKVGETILYTYDVTWHESDVAWSSRWDVYLSEDHFVPPQVHWYSITNSLIVVMILTLVMGCCMIKKLRKDVEADKAESEEDPDESAGWRALHGDVFRPPQTRASLYCTFVGTGAQIGSSLLVLLLLAIFGRVSPVQRGSLIQVGLVIYSCLGCVGGYVSSRLYKTFGGQDLQRCTMLTASLFPGVAFGLFLLLNIMFTFYRSTASVPFTYLVLLVFLWGFLALPSTYGGVRIGWDAGEIVVPTVTSSVAREIPPPKSWKCHPAVGLLVAGLFPFAAAYVELFFILTSLWMNQYYFVYGCAFLVYLIMLITCIQITSLFVYCQLCGENHQWWWYSFFCGGSIAAYICLYSMVWFAELEAPMMLITYMVYFGYMGLIAFAAFLVFGSAGALASLFMIRKIYSLIGFESEAERIRQGYSELSAGYSELQMQEEEESPAAQEAAREAA